METRKYINTYKINFGGKVDFDDPDALVFQTYIVAAEKKDKGKHGKEKKEKEKKKQEKIDKVANDPTTALVMGALGGMAQLDDKTLAPPPQKKKD